MVIVVDSVGRFIEVLSISSFPMSLMKKLFFVYFSN